MRKGVQGIKDRFSSDLSLHDYIQICLYDSGFGYYQSQPVIGKANDFITAPEISPFFGQCVAFWILQNIYKKKNTNWQLIECGPGLGTLVFDILFAIEKIDCALLPHKVFMLECSPFLKKKQEIKIQEFCKFITFEWVESVTQISKDHYSIVMGNEFLDVFPVQSFVKKDDQIWNEHYVSFQEDTIQLYEKPSCVPRIYGTDIFRPMDIYETSPGLQEFLRDLSDFINCTQGSVIFFDYGYIECSKHSTVQAIKAHKKVGLFDYPGEADITAWVNFADVRRILSEGGAGVYIENQSDFLIKWGLLDLTQRACNKKAAEVHKIRQSTNRLLNMGDQFKVCIVEF